MLRLFCQRLCGLFVCFLLTTPSALPSESDPNWLPDLKTEAGILHFLQSVNARHPGLLQKRSHILPNLLDFLQPVPGLSYDLDTATHDLTIRPTHRYVASYPQHAELRPDPTKLLEIADLIEERLNEFCDNAPRGFGFESLARDFARLVHDEARALQLLAIAPLLYDAGGNAIYQAPEQLAQLVLTDGDLQKLAQLYLRFWPEQLKPRLEQLASNKGFERLRGLMHTVEKDLYAREFWPRLSLVKRPIKSDQSRTMSIEELPALIGLLRSLLGANTLGLDSPYLSLLDSVRTYAIRNTGDFGAPADGYAVVLTANADKAAYPYVLAIGGSLSFAATQALLRAIGTIHRSPVVLVPENGFSEQAIEHDPTLRAMYGAARDRIKVGLPAGWRYLDRMARKRALGHFFEVEQVSTALAVPVSDFHGARFQLQAGLSVIGYERPLPLAQLAHSDRAVLAFQSLSGLRARELELRDSRIYELLQVIERDVAAVRKRKPLSSEVPSLEASPKAAPEAPRPQPEVQLSAAALPAQPLRPLPPPIAPMHAFVALHTAGSAPMPLREKAINTGEKARVYIDEVVRQGDGLERRTLLVNAGMLLRRHGDGVAFELVRFLKDLPKWPDAVWRAIVYQIKRHPEDSSGPYTLLSLRDRWPAEVDDALSRARYPVFIPMVGGGVKVNNPEVGAAFIRAYTRQQAVPTWLQGPVLGLLHNSSAPRAILSAITDVPALRRFPEVAKALCELRLLPVEPR